MHYGAEVRNSSSPWLQAAISERHASFLNVFGPLALSHRCQSLCLMRASSFLSSVRATNMPSTGTQTEPQLCANCRVLERRAVEYIGNVTDQWREPVSSTRLVDLYIVEHGAVAGCPCSRLLRFCATSTPSAPNRSISRRQAEEISLYFTWSWRGDRYRLDGLGVISDPAFGIWALVSNSNVDAAAEPFGASHARTIGLSCILTEALNSTKLHAGPAFSRGYGRRLALGMHELSSALSS